MRQGLAGLASAELVFRRGVGENERYVFKHALVRDAAYESLLLSRRRSVHARLVAALDHAAPPEIVARHAEAAALTDQAIRLYVKAGDLAVSRPAYREGAAHYVAALRLLEDAGDRPREELSVAAKRGVSLIGAEGYSAAQTVDAFAQARRLLDRLGDAPEWPTVRYGEWASRYVRADLPEAEALGLSVLGDLPDDDPHRFRSVANRMVATSQTMMGRFRDSLPYYAQALSHFDPVRDVDQASRHGTDPMAAASVYMALTQWFLGNIAGAYEHASAADEIGKMPDHPALSRANILGHISYLKHLNRDPDALDWSNTTLAVSDQAQIDIWRWLGLAPRAAIYAETADYAAALADVEDCKTALIKANAWLFMGCVFRAEARAYIGLGAFGRAERALSDIEPMMTRTTQRWDEADTRCAQAELALAFGDADEADRLYRSAIATAQSQAALSWERRAAIPLARLMAARGSRAEALTLLSDVQGKFDSGFETPDHRAASDLLRDLGAD